MSTILATSSDRPAWLEARRSGVTATDVARLARGGTNTWVAVRAEKAGAGREFHNSAPVGVRVAVQSRGHHQVYGDVCRA